MRKGSCGGIPVSASQIVAVKCESATVSHLDVMVPPPTVETSEEEKEKASTARNSKGNTNITSSAKQSAFQKGKNSIHRATLDSATKAPSVSFQHTPLSTNPTTTIPSPPVPTNHNNIYVPPLSAQTTLAPSPSSTNSPNPLTNTPSSLSSARFSKSQLRLLSLSAARQPSSNSRHSRASSTTSALTNRCRKNEEMRVKFARESKR